MGKLYGIYIYIYGESLYGIHGDMGNHYWIHGDMGNRGYGETLQEIKDMGNHFIGYGRQHGESRPDMGGSMVTTGYTGNHFIKLRNVLVVE